MKRTIIFWICLAVSLFLFVGGFFAPPTGTIDGSVLKASGILLAFSVVGQLPETIRAIKEAGVSKVSKGDFSLELHNKEE